MKQESRDFSRGRFKDTAHRNMRRWWLAYDAGAGWDWGSLEHLATWAGRRYMEAGGRLAEAFAGSIQSSKSIVHGCLPQTHVFSKHVAPALENGKTGYVLVDSLRYEMARELAGELAGEYEVSLSSAIATVPTITEIGMAALMPGAENCVKVALTVNGRLALEVGGALLKDRKDRMDYMRRVMPGTYDDKLGSLLPPSRSVRRGMEDAKLVVITSMENGSKRTLIPLENKRDFLEVSADIAKRVDPVFYGDPVVAARKALGMN